MNDPNTLIQLSDILSSDVAFELFEDIEFDPIYELRRHDKLSVEVVIKLIAQCKKLQTKEWYEYVKSLNPNYEEFFNFMISCDDKDYNDDFMNYFISLKPSMKFILEEVSYHRTSFLFHHDMIFYFENLNPSIESINLYYKRMKKHITFSPVQYHKELNCFESKFFDELLASKLLEQ
jgi:hypothetical protein